MHLYKFKYSRESNNQTKVLEKCPNTTLATISLRIERKNPYLTKDKETEKIVEKTRLKDKKEIRQ